MTLTRAPMQSQQQRRRPGRPSVAAIGFMLTLLAHGMGVESRHVGQAAEKGPETTNQDTRPTTIIVIGAGGAPQFDADFSEWANRWQLASEQAGHRSVVIGRDNNTAPQSDRQRLQAAIAAASQTPGVDLWLVMIGHGTYDRRDARFNLRGPDISATELASWLKPIERPMAIINTASASAPFLIALSGQKRVVIAATKSGSEQNFARFGDFMSQAISDPSADLDKDNQTSLWEAFLRASRQTTEFYATDGRLQTEHALMDDNGDQLGVRADQFRGLVPLEQAAGDKVLDGQYAHQWHLLRNATDAALPPDVLKKRDSLEFSVLQLRDQKKTIPSAEYMQRLERLLVELAELNESAGK